MDKPLYSYLLRYVFAMYELCYLLDFSNVMARSPGTIITLWIVPCPFEEIMDRFMWPHLYVV
jgi:hypothetical protein